MKEYPVDLNLYGQLLKTFKLSDAYATKKVLIIEDWWYIRASWRLENAMSWAGHMNVHVIFDKQIKQGVPKFRVGSMEFQYGTRIFPVVNYDDAFAQHLVDEIIAMDRQLPDNEPEPPVKLPSDTEIFNEMISSYIRYQK